MPRPVLGVRPDVAGVHARWLDEHPDFERRHVLPHRDRLLAMLGRFDEAHRVLAEAADRVEELGAVRFRMWLTWRRYEVARLIGDHIAAEAPAREVSRRPPRRQASSPTSCGSPATSPRRFSRSAGTTRPKGGSNEVPSWLQANGRSAILSASAPWKLLARRGELEEGERVRAEAVALAERRDMLERARRRAARSRRSARPWREGSALGARAGARALRAEGQPRHGGAHSVEAANLAAPA